jgi:Tfp pilus assembly protein PilO
VLANVMRNDLRKKQTFLIIGVAVYITVFAGGLYFFNKKLSLAKESFLLKNTELFNLEEKQKKSSELARILSDNTDKTEEIEKALVEQTFEKKQDLIFAIESITKTLNLEEHRIDVIGTLTSQDIAEERAQQARAQKRSQKKSSDEISEDKFPNVAFKVSFVGRYEDIVGFIERLRLLPYYMEVDNLAIATRNRGDESLAKLTANISFTIFTK